jgi:hypothetical protein
LKENLNVCYLFFFFAFLKFLGDAKLNFFVLRKKFKKIFCVFWKNSKKYFVFFEKIQKSILKKFEKIFFEKFWENLGDAV